ncbi:hypothetical protein AC477_04600 [miscellaneous Crenarchaeota group-1 archaeon SG8-32-1]|uniref:Uncharacterized protein n=1 Tax=miscellaneous Crenarchaeota group-1 archaeon SG8-32-1 TaxID=1685124 RepID=A0A0M0BQI8_9ARCH|nr:MAG: hypothetical protein AC477_04600 [miscellaneous Crenarchaeota group-1 archaeon SG8-32-1]
MDFNILINNAQYILILGGLIATSWFIEKLVKPVPVVGTPTSIFLKIISFFGFFAGIALLITGAAAWQAQTPNVDMYTIYLLIIAGLVLILKPIKDFPWAALLGLIAGGLCAGAVYFFLPLTGPIFGIAPIWIYVIIFLIPAVIVYMVFKFIEDVMKLIGTFLASRPITLIVGFVCIAQGILLLLGNNLFTLLLS